MTEGRPEELERNDESAFGTDSTAQPEPTKSDRCLIFSTACAHAGDR